MVVRLRLVGDGEEVMEGIVAAGGTVVMEGTAEGTEGSIIEITLILFTSEGLIIELPMTMSGEDTAVATGIVNNPVVMSGPVRSLESARIESTEGLVVSITAAAVDCCGGVKIPDNNPPSCLLCLFA